LIAQALSPMTSALNRAETERLTTLLERMLKTVDVNFGGAVQSITE
jgi:hypothetical protein